MCIRDRLLIGKAQATALAKLAVENCKDDSAYEDALNENPTASEFLKNGRKNTRAAAKPQEPIRKRIDFALVKVLFLIRKLYLERNKRQRADHLCAGQNRPAHGICKHSRDRRGSTGKPQRFQQILADADLAANGQRKCDS